MLYGKFQVGIGSIVLLLGTAGGMAFIVRELLGLGPYFSVTAWALTLVIGGRLSYLAWRRDWGSGNGASSRGEEH